MGDHRDKDILKIPSTSNFTHKSYSKGNLMMGYNRNDGKAYFINVDENGSLNGGSSSSIGGGSTTYSNAIGDFTTSTAEGTTDVTFSGLPFTLDEVNLANSVFIKLSSDGTTQTLSVNGYSISGDIVTLQGVDDFVAGDEIVAFIIGPDKGYFKDIDANADFTVNGPQTVETSFVNLVTDQDLTESWDDVGGVIDMGNGNDLGLAVNYVANDSTSTELRVVGLKTSDDTNEYELQPDSDTVKSLPDENSIYGYSFNVGSWRYLKVQVKAGTAGSTPGTITIDYNTKYN